MTEPFKAGPSKVGGMVRAALTWLKTVHRAWTERRALRRAYRELLSLTDHELNDIGITRGTIRARVYAPASDAPRAPHPVESAEAPFTAAEVARLTSGQSPVFAPANQNASKQRKAS